MILALMQQCGQWHTISRGFRGWTFFGGCIPFGMGREPGGCSVSAGRSDRKRQLRDSGTLGPRFVGLLTDALSHYPTFGCLLRSAR